MREQVLLFVQIQEVDLRKSRQKTEEKSLPEKLKAAEETLNAKKAEFSQLQTKASEREREKRNKELELKIQEEQIVKLRDRLVKIKTNEEYKANLKEIESAKVKKGELEESLLVAMEEGDLLKKEIASRAQLITEAERQFQAEKDQIEAAIQTLAVSTRSIEQEWLSLAEKAEKPLLEQYKKLLILRKGLAVVPLSGNTCGGCHFSLPPQRIAEVRTGEKILTCTYCHRMLYAPAKSE